MGSFTDNPQALGTFNPYVQQLPVEAMVKVGMEKQKQYNEGIQKIQTSIDNIAGLDIAKDADKAYLQSKVNELGNNLKFVAAGDFSDFQLVNSVNGMTGQLVKDPNVQNAVSSTAWLRKQQAEMEKAISEGKSSQSNIYDFNEQANRYLSSSTLGEKFNGRYTQYTDVKKKAMDAIKALHPDLIKYDIPFKVGNDGKIDTRFYADAMKRYKIEGISEAKIAQAIAASMTPDDLNQLKIDSKYEFRGAGFEQLAEKAKGDYDMQKQQAVAALEFLETQRTVTTDPTRIDQLNEQITGYKEKLGIDGKPGTLEENYYKNIELAKNDPDEVKYNIYKNGFVSEFANAFKWSSKEEEALANPYKAQENFTAEMKLKQEQFKQNKYEFAVNSQYREIELGQKAEENRLKAEANALQNAELYGLDAPWTPLGNPTDNENRGQELFTNHTVSVKDSIDLDKAALAKKGYTEKEINTMLNNWNDAQGVPSKANIPANAIKDIINITKNQNYVDQLREFEIKTRAESEQKAGVADVINKTLIGKTGLDFTHKGERINLTPREIIDVKLSETKVKVRDNQGHLVETTLINTGKLNPKQLKYAEAMYGKNSFGTYKNGQLVKAGYSGYPTSSVEDRAKIDKITRPHIYAANEIKGAYNKAEDIYMKTMGSYANVFVPRIKAVANSKGEVPPLALQGLNQLIIASVAKGIETDDKFDAEIASEYLTESKTNKLANTRVLVEQDGDKYKIKIQNLSDPQNFQSFKVNAADVQAYLGDKYINKNVRESARFTIGGGKSDILHKNQPSRAMMQKRFGDFPGIKKLQVAANLEEDGEGSNLFIPTIYLKQKDGKYVRFEISGDDKLSRVGLDQGRDNLNRLNDRVLMNILKQAYPSYDFDSKIDY
jgi:hypothetical protein